MPEFPLIENLGDGRFRVTFKNCKPIEYTHVDGLDKQEASLEQLHPLFKPKVDELIKKLEKKLGTSRYRIQINNTLRTLQEEEEIKKKNSKVQAKNYSAHCFGLAIDISVIDKKLKQAVTQTDDIKKVLEQTAEELKIYWGGWFKNPMPEPWHFQLAAAGVWEKMYDGYKEPDEQQNKQDKQQSQGKQESKGK